MKPIKITDGEGAELTIACEHWKVWPPTAVLLGQTIDELRARKVIDDAAYQRIQVYQRVCGLKGMDPEVCMECPHVRKVTSDHTGLFLTTLDNTKSSRIYAVDGRARGFKEALTATIRKPGQRYSGENAPWVIDAQQD